MKAYSYSMLNQATASFQDRITEQICEGAASLLNRFEFTYEQLGELSKEAKANGNNLLSFILSDAAAQLDALADMKADELKRAYQEARG